jgi:hypothetical protein
MAEVHLNWSVALEGHLQSRLDNIEKEYVNFNLSLKGILIIIFIVEGRTGRKATDSIRMH